MAKAYKELRKPDASPRVTKMFCASCDEWEEETEWTAHVCYQNHRRYVFFDVDDDSNSVYIFGDPSEEVTTYEHRSCGNWFVNPEKDVTGDKDIYVCGECGKRTYDQNAARRCCT